MTTLLAVTDEAVLRAWALAELRGPAGATAVTLGLLSSDVLDRLRTGREEALGEDGWAQVVAAIEYKRAPLIGNLFTLGIDWAQTVFNVPRLQALGILAIPEWHAKYPSHRMDELAGARHVVGADPEFRGFETTGESPIAVCATLEGPCCLVEGYTRVATFLRDVGAGLTPDREMRMLLGVSPRLHEWVGPTGWRWWP